MKKVKSNTSECLTDKEPPKEVEYDLVHIISINHNKSNEHIVHLTNLMGGKYIEQVVSNTPGICYACKQPKVNLRIVPLNDAVSEYLIRNHNIGSDRNKEYTGIKANIQTESSTLSDEGQIEELSILPETGKISQFLVDKKEMQKLTEISHEPHKNADIMTRMIQPAKHTLMMEIPIANRNVGSNTATIDQSNSLYNGKHYSLDSEIELFSSSYMTDKSLTKDNKTIKESCFQIEQTMGVINMRLNKTIPTTLDVKPSSTNPGYQSSANINIGSNVHIYSPFKNYWEQEIITKNPKYRSGSIGSTTSSRSVEKVICSKPKKYRIDLNSIYHGLFQAKIKKYIANLPISTTTKTDKSFQKSGCYINEIKVGTLKKHHLFWEKKLGNIVLDPNNCDKTTDPKEKLSRNLTLRSIISQTFDVNVAELRKIYLHTTKQMSTNDIKNSTETFLRVMRHSTLKTENQQMSRLSSLPEFRKIVPKVKAICFKFEEKIRLSDSSVVTQNTLGKHLLNFCNTVNVKNLIKSFEKSNLFKTPNIFWSKY
ncbi:uncharacterized protein LOC119662375 isoform X2 [Teleopsis dalmanni]|uniref:uncharacterized protein LOC119662375 isoform X2 n=1 Tax=Teleopsis dalmanni TaxID=139649 RepID=UPI0018CF7F03|nr:uncharacterized protein LOC119662375 isoform X2 [Teleopsis dalmanni]